MKKGLPILRQIVVKNDCAWALYDDGTLMRSWNLHGDDPEWERIADPLTSTLARESMAQGHYQTGEQFLADLKAVQEKKGQADE